MSDQTGEQQGEEQGGGEAPAETPTTQVDTGGGDATINQGDASPSEE